MAGSANEPEVFEVTFDCGPTFKGSNLDSGAVRFDYPALRRESRILWASETDAMSGGS